MFKPVEGAIGVFHGIEERTRGPQRAYFGSVLQRVSGVDAFQRWQVYAETHLDRDARRSKMISGTIFGFGQFLFPAMTSWAAYEHTREPHFIPMLARGVAAGAIDCGTLLLLQHEPNISVPDAVALKLATNLATHTLVAAVRFGMDHVRRFRPLPPATLAV